MNYTCRIAKEKGLDKTPDEQPLNEYIRNAESCFFCEGRVENQTPMMPEEIDSAGRIVVGEALLFPNLSGFGRYSGVCIFSKEHFISSYRSDNSQPDVAHELGRLGVELRIRPKTAQNTQEPDKMPE